MSLKPTVASLEEVPETLRDFYSENNGKFVLSVDGMVPKDRLDEFRDNNIALRREKDALEARYKDIDPDHARELMARAQRERDKKLIDAGKVDELLAERTQAMKLEYERQMASLTSERDGLNKRLGELVIDSAIRDAAAKSGVRSTAVDDVLLRARTVFRLEDGQAVAMDGDRPRFGKAGEPLSVAEWVADLASTAPHLFEASRGSGAPGSGASVPRAPGVIDRNDTKAFLANLDKIAKGEIKVQ